MSGGLLVTGAGGLLGGALCEALAPTREVWAGAHRAVPPPGVPAVAMDLERPQTLAAALRASRAVAVLHCAALADADACERDAARARALNVDATAALADACARSGARLALISTDLVFGPELGLPPRDEGFPARALSVYGATKLEAERIVLGIPGNAVFRVALVTGRGHGPRGSATEGLAWALRAGRPLRLFRDQFRTPVDPVSLARLLSAWAVSPHDGLFHAGGPERVSRLELGHRVAAVLGLPAEGLVAVDQDDALAPAVRPREAAMDSGRATRLLGYEPEPLDAAIRAGRAAPPTA